MEREIVETLKADDVKVGFNHAVEVKGRQSPQSLTVDFHTEKGWVRIRLEGDACSLFDKTYKQQTSGRITE